MDAATRSESLERRRRSARASAPALAFAAALLVLASCDDRSAPPLVHSERIGSIGKDYRKRSLVVSPDHRRMAWVQVGRDDCRVVLDGDAGPTFAECIDPRFSHDGGTFTYWARRDRSEPPKGHLVANGRIVPIDLGKDGTVASARRAPRWAAVAQAYDSRGLSSLLGNPPPVPTFDPTAAESAARPSPTPATSGAGETSPAPARSPAPDESPSPAASPSPVPPPRRLVVFDETGVLGEHFDTTTPAVSPEGAHVAYVAADVEGKHRLVVDGRVVRTFEKPSAPYLPVIKDASLGANLDPEYSVLYLADGSLVTVALAEQGWTVFHGDEVWASYPALQIPRTGYRVLDPRLLTSRTMAAGTMVAAADAPVACWWERLEGMSERWRVVCNGAPIDDQLCDNYWVGFPISVGATGRSVGYGCPVNPEVPPGAAPPPSMPLFVVANGMRFGPHAFVWGVDVTADGAHYAYAAADTVTDPWFYVVDGRRFDGPWMRAFPPKLSPDGKSVAWAAAREEEGNRVDLVLDGNLVARAEVVMETPLFDGERKVQWAVKRGHSVRRVVACTRWAPLDFLRPLVCW